MTTAQFKDFPLDPAVQRALETLGFTEPTEIQNKAIPLLLANAPIDFHGQAQTGTGKTLAFGIPLLHRIDQKSRATQALIVAPTRELAQQIRDSIRPLAQALNITVETVYGGASMEEQVRNLKRGVHIVVGTPGRLNDHLRRRTLQLDAIKTLVLDEADIMLDMGFKDEVDEILNYAPKSREIWLFSATVKSGISTIMAQHMKNTQTVKAVKKISDTPATKQYYCMVPSRLRLQALCRFIENAPEFYGFIFCQTKVLTSEIAELLIRRGYNVGALHGDLSQSQRNATIKKFKNKEVSIVVATDVAARGIDIANLTHVVNYSLPEDHESYVHRIGRTGRAGKEGIAITFINKSEGRLIDMIQRKFNFVIQPLSAPSRETIITSRMVQATNYVTNLAASLDKPINPEMVKLVENFTDEQVRMALAHVLVDKFLSTINAEEDFSSAVRQSQDGRESRGQDADVQEFCISVGLDDGVSQADVIDYVTKTGILTEDQIRKVRVIKRRSFVEVPTNCAAQLINALRNTTLGGRRVSLNIIEATEESSQRREMGRRAPYSGGGRSSDGYNRPSEGGYRRR